MKTSIVLGLGFGDEGKGMVVSSLASLEPENAIVIRFGGGHQVGHTVVTDKEKHVFSNLGSGTLHGVPTYWSEHCTLDPVGLMREFISLEKKGYKPVLYVDGKAMITTPYDILVNQDQEKVNEHGSVGVGFGSTIQRNEDHYHLYANDINYPSIFEEKLKLIESNYYPGVFIDTGITNIFNQSIDWMRKNTNIIITNSFNYSDFDHLIYEGHQGILLDQEYGFFPHVTRSYTTVKNIPLHSFYKDTTIYYTTRAYQTRHGNGPMIGGSDDGDGGNINVNNEGETNIDNKYQGEFRICSLDTDAINYAYECNKREVKSSHTKARLVITCLDQMDWQWRDRELPKVLGRITLKDSIGSYSPFTEDIFKNKI